MRFWHTVAGGLTPIRVLIIAVILCCVMTGATFWASLYQFGTYRAGQQHIEQTAAQQGRVVAYKLCTSLSQLAALRPPAGDPSKNPARGYDQRLHAVLSQLGPDVGCPVKAK